MEHGVIVDGAVGRHLGRHDPVDDALVPTAERAQPVFAQDLVDVEARAEDVGVVAGEVGDLADVDDGGHLRRGIVEDHERGRAMETVARLHVGGPGVGEKAQRT